MKKHEGGHPKMEQKSATAKPLGQRFFSGLLHDASVLPRSTTTTTSRAHTYPPHVPQRHPIASMVVATRRGSTKSKASAGGNGNGASTAPSSSTTTTGSSSTSSPPSRLWDVLYAALLVGSPLKLLWDIPADAFAWRGGPENAHYFILEQLGLAAAGVAATVHMVNVMGDYCRRKEQTGRDLCKKGTPAGDVPIPESQGLAPGIIYLVLIIACQLLYTQSPESLANYNSSLLSICFMLFLGFVDDVLDLPWRYKLILPPIATLPLLCSYSGSTSVIVPKPLRAWLWHRGTPTSLGQLLGLFVTVDAQAQGKIVELGVFFMVYMALLSVFCTNAINIYAGINGLEVGQSLVIAVGILSFKLWEILHESDGKGGPAQVLSLTLILPFIGVVLGLLWHNFYPARAFVGDTFCYFAGMTFAVIGVHGHFSKTLCFLFLPQIANFLLSLPQLFKVVPCPRHRLPRYDAAQDKLLPSICPCAPHEYRWVKRLFGLDPDSEFFVNLTLINVVLRVLGPTHERTLCLVLLLLQVLCCLATMYLRFHLATWFA